MIVGGDARVRYEAARIVHVTKGAVPQAEPGVHAVLLIFAHDDGPLKRSSGEPRQPRAIYSPSLRITQRGAGSPHDCHWLSYAPIADTITRVQTFDAIVARWRECQICSFHCPYDSFHKQVIVSEAVAKSM